MAKTIDAAAFAKAYEEALPAHAEAIAAKAGLLNLEDVGGTFCEGWDRIAGFLNMAVRALGLFRPKEAAMAKAFLAAVRKTVVPILCGKE
jgi:hypothetical protein